jgi:predicted RNA binding protein YcfA (HicA-like mRNA interferase family)
MGSLPSLSGKEAVRVFESFGWSVARRRSSHIIMTKEGEIATLSIPDHKEVAKGTLRSLIRSANLTIDEFIAASDRSKRSLK